MKICRKCSREFIPTPTQLHKADYICRECMKDYNRQHMAERKAKGLSNSGSRTWDAIKKADWIKEYSARPEVRAKRAEQMRGYRNNPLLRERHMARWMVRRRITSGKIQRMPCEICGDTKSEAHHDDYTKPLDIRWLCKVHHMEADRNMKATGDDNV